MTNHIAHFLLKNFLNTSLKQHKIDYMQFDVYFYSFQNHFVQHHKNNLLLLNNPLNNLLPLLHYIQHILLLDVYYIDEFSYLR